jgi:U3 small nucleolar RNA-associated protein 10
LNEAEKPLAIYGFDYIYGEGSGSSAPSKVEFILLIPSIANLQYLEWMDLRKYIGAMVEHRHHLASDAGYIRVFQRQALTRQKSDTKKDTGYVSYFLSTSSDSRHLNSYKRKLLCYLLSHVNACHLPVVKLGLLRSMQEVADLSKLQMLLPTIQEVLADSPTTLETSFGDSFPAFVALLLRSFDISAAKALNESSGASWFLYTQALKKAFVPGEIFFKISRYWN